MMKRNLFLMAMALMLSFIAHSQSSNPKHKNYFKSDDQISNKTYTVHFKDIVAKMDYAKLAMEIRNKSNDFMMFHLDEAEFVFDFGKYHPKEKTIFIFPNTSKRETLKVFGGYQFHVDAFQLIVDGLYVIPYKVKATALNDFKLPASTNSLEASNFSVHLVKTSQKTSETYAKFQVEYTGEQVAIIDPSKISVKVDGTNLIYANDDKKSKPILLRRGEKTSIKAVFHIPGRIADMQFSTLYIAWGDCFKESKPQKVKPTTVHFILDEGLTNAKNK